MENTNNENSTPAEQADAEIRRQITAAIMEIHKEVRIYDPLVNDLIARGDVQTAALLGQMSARYIYMEAIERATLILFQRMTGCTILNIHAAQLDALHEQLEELRKNRPTNRVQVVTELPRDFKNGG